MDLNEALRILIDEGMLVERQKKYRTTPEERERTKSSWYDTYGGNTIQEKIRKIIVDAGLGEYFGKVDYNKEYIDIYYYKNEKLVDLLEKLSPKFSFELKSYNGQPYMRFEFDLKSKLSQKKLDNDEAIARALYKRFGIPKNLVYWYDSEACFSQLEYNYDKIEKFIEDKQYGGIHDLNFEDFKQTVEDAFKWAVSEKNQYKHVKNNYGFEKQIDEFYVKFSRLCNILYTELHRKRGRL